MAITKLNSLAIPAGTVEPADISYPLTTFSSTGIDDNATSTAITIDASEQVGIGDAVPDVKLKIKGGAGTIEPQVTIESTAFNAGQGTALNFSRAGFNQPIQARISAVDNGAAGSNFIFSTKVDGTAGALTERMRIDSSGRVGIGTSTPNYSIDTANAIYSGADSYTGPNYGDLPGYIYLNGLSGGTGIVSAYDSSARYVLSSGTTDTQLITYNNTGFKINSNSTGLQLGSSASGAGVIQFQTGVLLTTRMTIDSSGNVGIGESSPTYALHIKDTANSSNKRRITIESNSNAGANAGYRFALNSANSTVRGGGLYFVPGDTDAATYLGLSSTDSDYALVATRENNIGIGTAAPSRMLHLRDTASTIIKLEADTDNATESDIAAIEMSQDGGITTGYIGLNGSNDLVIGANSTTAPDIVFNTAGTGTSYLDGSTGTKMIIHNSGEVTKPLNPAFFATHSSSTATGKIPYNNENYDIGSNFDTTNNRFTAPVAGYYFFSFWTLTTYAYNGDTRCAFRKNGAVYPGTRHIINKTNWDSSRATALIYCAVNDYVEAWFDGLPTSGAAYGDSNYNGFFGFLVS